MKIELDVYSTICDTKLFKINGIKADYKDFGRKSDCSPDKNRPNSCGNMIFEPVKPKLEILEKYGITIKEYEGICEQLRACVSFGMCTLCA
ncbi:MAG TPA: hypothetical protein VHT96_10095 [Clostridia bacterium]|nr:hypothetical protein [Clostridia bacterium]